MHLVQLGLCVLASAALSSASVFAAVRSRPVRCGNTEYSHDDLDLALAAACRSPMRGRGYPHVFNNHEGFDFGQAQGRFFEFPLKKNAPYTGGPPGSDRIIYQRDGSGRCVRVGAISHPGPGSSSFVGCSGTQLRSSSPRRRPEVCKRGQKTVDACVERQNAVEEKDVEEEKKEKKRLKKGPPEQDGPPTEEKRPNVKRPISQRIAENRFMQFISSLSPDAFQPLTGAIRDGSFSVYDCQLGFKRALSDTITKRYGDFATTDEALESIANILSDAFSATRAGTPPGFWGDVVRALPGIAREIAQGKTPAERLRIADRNVSPVVWLWSKTVLGQLNQSLMRESASAEGEGRGILEQVAIVANRVWAKTPVGWAVNKWLWH